MVLLPAWILSQGRVQANLLQWDGIEIVAWSPVQVLCEHGDGTAVVWIILADACALVVQAILGRILLRIVARFAEILVVVTLVGGVSSVQYVATQFLSTKVDVCDAPTLQVVHAEAFAEEFARTLTTNLIEHGHLVTNGLVGVVIPPSCIPNVLDKLVAEVCHTGTVAEQIDGDVEVGIRDLTIAQLAGCLGVVQVNLGKAKNRPVWRLGLVWAVTFWVILTATIAIKGGVVAQRWMEDSLDARVGRVGGIELIVVLHDISLWVRLAVGFCMSYGILRSVTPRHSVWHPSTAYETIVSVTILAYEGAPSLKLWVVLSILHIASVADADRQTVAAKE